MELGGPGPSHPSGVGRRKGDPSGRATTPRSLLADRSGILLISGSHGPLPDPPHPAGTTVGGAEPAILSQGAGAARAARRSRPPRSAPRPAGARSRGPNPVLPRPHDQLTTRTPRQPYPSRRNSVPAPSLPVPLQHRARAAVQDGRGAAP